MDNICYKVVMKVSNSSLFMSICYLPSLTYLIEKTTYPRVGKIFVFDTYENADFFLKAMRSLGFSILKGIAENVSHPKRCSHSFSDIELFWKLKKQKKSIRDISFPVVKGTIWCDSFTPTEIVNQAFF